MRAVKQFSAGVVGKLNPSLYAAIFVGLIGTKRTCRRASDW
jgi:hypothetical protein